MTRLPGVSGKQCIRALERAGFKLVRTEGSHHYMRRVLPFCQVSVPLHRSLKKGLLHGILRSAGLSVEDFLKLL
ncbi:MAG: type II toxin-antitoxin system HicA family toxin [Deltaproteobacteria bacterium]|nr:type II toxin-antitoxin system HicA family toxin [Deltaproteobacteria bacterium]